MMMRRIIRSVATRGRLIAMSLVGLIGILIGVAINRSDPGSDFVPAEFLDGFGLIIFVPLVALVISTATIGDMLEERNLVYYWLRPIGRWKITLAAWLGAIVVLLPLVLIPMGVLGAIIGTGDDVAGILVGSLIGIVAYSAVFTMLGAFTQRALVVGLVYILLWEGVIAGFSRTAGWFALRTYTRSALANVADVALLDQPPQTTSIVLVTIAVALAAGLITTWRLNTMDVD
ncbi:MAG: hypothetical protein HKN94_14805 [Acidimicrobiales bacterium]|nr:hypothetical protein [Acidimicrobiales bacterium]RZV48061.1 MAG: hypothetical protein EX269_03050 [Acidimicrobiales bacterium]